MGREKNKTNQAARQKPASSWEDGSGYDEIELLPPKTAEDFVLAAVEKAGLAEVVRILRDWHGSKEIRSELNKLAHRDPMDRFKHARRRAVEIYATEHGITPANLMVAITGSKDRSDAEGSERGKLRAARKYLASDPNARFAAVALAEHWTQTRPDGRDATKHIKDVDPEV